jgi:hypothetical protein
LLTLLLSRASPIGITIHLIQDRNSDMEIRIVVFPHGWILVGRFKRNGSNCRLFNARVIRNWGTTKGLGEIAANGPLPQTKLDTVGVVEFDYPQIIFTVKCGIGWEAYV